MPRAAAASAARSAGRAARQPRGLRAALAQLVGDQTDERDRERQQVVDGAIDDQRGQQFADGRYGFSSSTISPSNTPTPPGTWLARPSSCAARNAPRNARNGSRLAAAARRARRRPAPSRRTTRPAAPAAIAAAAAAARAGANRMRRRANHGGATYARLASISSSQPTGATQTPAPEVASARGSGLERQAQPAERAAAEPERHRVRKDDPRQLLRRDAPARVEAIAHRGAGEHREADVVGDRVGQERGERDRAARQPLADVGEREEVVAGQDGVVERRSAAAASQLARRRARGCRAMSSCHVTARSSCRSTSSAATNRMQADERRERAAKPLGHRA